MFLHTVIVVSCLCVVKAHVYTINIFNYKNEQELEQPPNSEVQDCNPLNCDQSCRRIGFSGGACVRGHCKCDILESPPAFSKLDEFQKYDVVQDCNPLNCDQSCRRIGFPGGACVRGHCKCDILEPPPGLSELDESLTYDEVQDCNPLNCDQSCHRIGFPGGACVRDHCKCDILEPPPFMSKSENSIKFSEVQDCNLRWCEQTCRKIGFPGGVCVNGRCKCDILVPLPVSDDYKVLDETDLKEESLSSSKYDKESNMFPFEFLGKNEESNTKEENLTTPSEIEVNNVETLSHNDEDNMEIINDTEKDKIKLPSVTEEDNFTTQKSDILNYGVNTENKGSITNIKTDEQITSTKKKDGKSESKIYFMDCTTNSWTCGLICHKMNYIGGKCVNKKCMCHKQQIAS